MPRVQCFGKLFFRPPTLPSIAHFHGPLERLPPAFHVPLERILSNYSTLRYYSAHALSNLITQRLCGLTLGYEDVSDHDNLRDESCLHWLWYVTSGHGKSFGQDTARLNKFSQHIYTSSRTFKLHYVSSIGYEIVIELDNLCYVKRW